MRDARPALRTAGRRVVIQQLPKGDTAAEAPRERTLSAQALGTRGCRAAEGSVRRQEPATPAAPNERRAPTRRRTSQSVTHHTGQKRRGDSPACRVSGERLESAGRRLWREGLLTGRTREPSGPGGEVDSQKQRAADRD